MSTINLTLTESEAKALAEAASLRAQLLEGYRPAFAARGLPIVTAYLDEQVADLRAVHSRLTPQIDAAFDEKKEVCREDGCPLPADMACCT